MFKDIKIVLSFKPRQQIAPRNEDHRSREEPRWKLVCMHGFSIVAMFVSVQDHKEAINSKELKISVEMASKSLSPNTSQGLLSDSDDAGTGVRSAINKCPTCTPRSNLRLSLVLPWILSLIILLSSVVSAIRSAESCERDGYWRQSDFGMNV
jgi:hypothetical protein